MSEASRVYKKMDHFATYPQIFCSHYVRFRRYNVAMSITSLPQDFSTMFLDMNSFFASVEQQVQPTLRGVPVGVAPYTGRTGCIIAASKEAKARGVKIGLVGEAKKICSEIKIIEARPALYMIYHHEIKKVIESFTPYFSPLSIDEFKIRLTRQDQSEAAAIKLAQKLKMAIRERVGDSLTCSIGIGPSTFLAKMAGERMKPDGLTVVTLKNLKQFYLPLKLTDITGINWRTETHLKNFGIDSPIRLFDSPVGELVRILNHPGRLWYFRLRGYEVDEFSIKSPESAKTIGHSHVLAPEFRTRSGAISILKKLVFKAGYRLRKNGYQAGGVSVFIQFTNGVKFSHVRKFDTFSDNQSFWQNVASILKDCTWRGQPILVAVSASNLIRSIGDQLNIFADIEKSKAVSRALDAINDVFGAETVFPASMFDSRNSAPDRIPFGVPRYDIQHF